MIFATVGTQLPFPRLIALLDRLAPILDEKIVAQIGNQSEAVRNLESYRSIAPQQFEAFFLAADKIVAHAGIGTILTAKRLAKPIVIFPRRADRGEHRNDHQLATARQLENHRGIYVAYDEAALERLLGTKALDAPDSMSSLSLIELKTAIRGFLDES